MDRTAYERVPLLGFQTPRVESIAVSSAGERLYAGTQDGSLCVYDCRPDTNAIRQSAYECSLVDTLRRGTREKKPIQYLLAIEAWRVLVGIMDSFIIAYDINTLRPLSSINETKGCTIFAVHEKSWLLCVVTKKKISLFSWQGLGFVARREIALSDTPRAICCTENHIVVGYRREYWLMDISQTGLGTKILETDREYRTMVCLEVPASSTREASLLLSNGSQGILYDPNGTGQDERLEWSSVPYMAHLSMPFLITLLQNSVEIHDIGSLSPVQSIEIAAPVYVCSCDLGAGLGQCVYVAAAAKIHVLKMVPLATQVTALADVGKYEEALSICGLCNDRSLLAEIDVSRIHERYAYSLNNRGDFEGSVQHFIAADTNPTQVIYLLTDLIPRELPMPSFIQDQGHSGRSLQGSMLHRAASAMVKFCEHHRNKCKLQADRVESHRLGSSSSGKTEYDVSFETEENIIKVAQLVDTVLMTCLLSCNPPRRQSVIELLSSPNRCHIESCAVLLASKGQAYTEALLWLYRSHGAHRRVVSALTEDCCVGPNAWTREQFYAWMAEYLRTLWREDDVDLRRLVLSAIRPLLEVDPELGLSVLTQPGPLGDQSLGRGVSPHEIVKFLQEITPTRPVPVDARLLMESATIAKAGFNKRSSKRQSVNLNTTANPSHTLPVPLVNGRLLAIAYLEFLVYNQAVLKVPSMHDEYAQLLLEAIPMEACLDHKNNDLELRETDTEDLLLYKVLRQKLQYLLETSQEYNSVKILKIIPPPFLHEFALLLSRLGRHEEVLRIYVHHLSDHKLAESYCERVWLKGRAMVSADPAAQLNSVSRAEQEVYLHYMKVLRTPEQSFGGEMDGVRLASNANTSGRLAEDRIKTVIDVAGRYFDRVDAARVLDQLPENTPLSLLAEYLSKVLRHGATKKKNLQVVHQLLRVREVKLRTDYLSKQAAYRTKPANR